MVKDTEDKERYWQVEKHKWWGAAHGDWRESLKYAEEWTKAHPEKIQYPDRIKAANKKAKEEWGTGARDAWYAARRGTVSMFILWWNTLKEIGEKYNVDVMTLAREQWFKSAFEEGQQVAKARKERGLGNGIIDYYDERLAKLDEGPSKFIWFELNDKRMHYWNMRCAMHQFFQEAGMTDEEIKELAPLFCSVDAAFAQGFNPNFEAYPYPRIQMAGDPHCSRIIEDHGAEQSGEAKESRA